MFNLHMERTIDVAHKLKNHEGKCKNLHGHTMKIEVDVNADGLIKAGSQEGMVADFGVIKDIIDMYDHRYLNDLVDMKMPTAERLAEILCNEIIITCREYNPTIYSVKVRVHETDSQSVVCSKTF